MRRPDAAYVAMVLAGFGLCLPPLIALFMRLTGRF